MCTLEELAKNIFTKYSLERTGKTSNWNLLQASRKLAWVEEVYFFIQFIAKDLRTSIKPTLIDTKVNTSFNLGFISGMNEERVKLINYFNNLQEISTKQ